MKNSIISFVLLLLLLSSNAIAQVSKKGFINEVHLSVNRTTLQNDNTEDRFGFGAGLFGSLMLYKSMFILVGAEYNRTSQFKKSMYEDHFATSTNLTYKLNWISIPLGLSYNFFTESASFFAEGGGFADFLFNTIRTGTMHRYSLGENNEGLYTETEIKEKTKLSNSFGVYAAVGVRIHISNYQLVIKPEYKHGINKLNGSQDAIYKRYVRLNVGLKF